MSRKDFVLTMLSEHPEKYPVTHGYSSYVHPSVEIPEWVTIGDNVIIHAGVVFGAQGFGFERIDGDIQTHIPHIGEIIIEDDVEIFDLTVITRGTVGNTVLKKGSKIDALVHIAHNVIFGENSLVCSHGGIGGSAVIGKNVFLGTGTIIKAHVKIADGTLLGSGSNVIYDITEENGVWAGNPAKFLRYRRPGE